MALADITLIDSQVSPVSHVFAFIGYDSAGRVVRKDHARTPDLPLLLTIGHKPQKVGGISVDSHLWRLDDTIMDADGVTARRANIRVMADIPPSVYSDARMEDYVAMLTCAFTETFGKAWARGSVG